METSLKGQSHHLISLMDQSKERQAALLDEKRCVEDLVQTLTQQNKSILQELESYSYTNEIVRTHLDRREEVSHMMNTFNKDLVESKLNLERQGNSPLRSGSPYR